MAFHQRLWDLLAPVGGGVSPYYAPSSWVPRITLAGKGVTPSHVGGVMERLCFRPFWWRIRVSNLAVIYQPPGEVGRLRTVIPLP